MAPRKTLIDFYIYLGYLYSLYRLLYKQDEQGEHNTLHRPHRNSVNARTKYP